MAVFFISLQYAIYFEIFFILVEYIFSFTLQKVLDILKIDIEGDEWKAIPQILASVSNKFIKQIVIEIHFGRRTKGLKGDGFMSYMQNNWGDTSLFAQLDTLKQLEHHGFKTFRSLKNPRAKLQLKYSYETFVFTAHVVSLKNTNIQTQ
jgi:hypothetical protein